MHVYYRISDKGNPKPKLANASKAGCLQNALEEFGKENLYVIADNCNTGTLSFLKESGISFEETSLGNAKSFIHMAQLIFSRESPEDPVYLLEDDYLHLGGSKKCLLEGLEIADYVTLYDHPNKYLLSSEGGNPFNFRNIRPSRLFHTASTHWRTTDSTTMTFACKVKTLQEDFNIWKKYLKGRSPDDFNAFVELTQSDFSAVPSFIIQGRRRPAFFMFRNFLFRSPGMRILLSSVPARSTHAELAFLAPVIHWETTLEEVKNK